MRRVAWLIDLVLPDMASLMARHPEGEDLYQALL
jgi:hypothetical protein